MSYQVLARKWRPQVFDDVVGQAHITRTLQNAISTQRLAHAFLFSGPRGVGKTTTARILAKALNCAQGPTPTPCGKCDSCLETTAGSSVDVIEIDGASNRGIEHIRELREAVKYAPAGGKYKVYVIDEVHMLTNEAFNALLKTLEEPPPHVIFIFATTEPQKIPATIHSRCQRYGFKRIPLHEITGRLRLIADTEKITISEEGLSMIARAAEGSMRDSQSLLDQAVSYSGMEIKDEDLQATLGAVAQVTLLQFAERLLGRDAAGLLKQVDDLLERGQDMRQFLAGVVEHIRNLVVVKLAKQPADIIELPAADIKAISEQAATAEMEQLLLLFDSLSKTLDDLRWSPYQRFTLEIGLVKACSVAPLQPLQDVLAHLQDLEGKVLSGAQPSQSFKPAPPAPTRLSERPRDYAPKAPASHKPSPETQKTHSADGNLWSAILQRVKEAKPSLASFLDQAKLIEVSDSKITIGIPGSFQLAQAEKPENRDSIAKAASAVLNKTVQVALQPLTASPQQTTEAKKKEHVNNEEEDPAIQHVLQVFTKGEVIEKNNPSE